MSYPSFVLQLILCPVATLLKNGLKEQVVGACDGFAHLPVLWEPDQHSILLYCTPVTYPPSEVVTFWCGKELA